MTKRILSVALVLVLTFALSSSVLAAGVPHTAFTFEEGVVTEDGMSFSVNGLLAIQAEEVTLNLLPLDADAYTISNDSKGKVTTITLLPETVAELDDDVQCLIVNFDKAVVFATFDGADVEVPAAADTAVAATEVAAA